MGFYLIGLLFVFDRSGGLRGEVVEYAVYSVNLVGYPVGYALEDVPVYSLYRRRHRVLSIYGTDNAGPLKAALAALYAGGLEIGNYGEILPHLAHKARLLELLA